MSRSAEDQFSLAEQRNVVIDSMTRLMGSFLDDYFPGISLEDASALIVILEKMYDSHRAGREATIASLSRVLRIPRITVQRRLAVLTKKEFVARTGRRYALRVEPFNEPARVEGFKRRLGIIRGLGIKLFEMGAFN